MTIRQAPKTAAMQANDANSSDAGSAASYESDLGSSMGRYGGASDDGMSYEADSEGDAAPRQAGAQHPNGQAGRPRQHPQEPYAQQRYASTSSSSTTCIVCIDGEALGQACELICTPVMACCSLLSR